VGRTLSWRGMQGGRVTLLRRIEGIFWNYFS
jgi:hypothetical protein